MINEVQVVENLAFGWENVDPSVKTRKTYPPIKLPINDCLVCIRCGEFFPLSGGFVFHTSFESSYYFLNAQRSKNEWQGCLIAHGFMANIKVGHVVIFTCGFPDFTVEMSHGFMKAQGEDLPQDLHRRSQHFFQRKLKDFHGFNRRILKEEQKSEKKKKQRSPAHEQSP